MGQVRPFSPSSLRLLLGRGGGLGGLLAVAADHDGGEEGADDGGPEKDQDDGYPDGPDARGEEVLKGVVGVDEGLVFGCVSRRIPLEYNNTVSRMGQG